MVDDAAITFAYARSLAEGLGPVLAAGAPPVEGFSNPTWTVLLAIARLLGLFDRGALFGIPDYVLVPRILALAFCALLLVGCYRAAQRATRRPALTTLITGLVLAAIPSFVIWCFSGLENSLFACTVVWLAVIGFRASFDNRLLHTKTAMAAGLLAAVAALTRPDGAIYVAAYPLVLLIHVHRLRLWPCVRSGLYSVVAFAVPFGAYVVWRYFEFGQLLSNTAVAKGQSFPNIGALLRPVDLVGYAGALAVLVVAGLVGRASSRIGLATLLVPLGLAILAYSVLNPDWMGQFRFATPVWALAALIGTIAAVNVFEHLRARGRVVLAVVLVIALTPSADAFARTTVAFRAAPTFPMCFVVDRIGRQFNEYADILNIKQGSVLAPDMGGTALTSRLQIVDMAGLANETVARFYQQHDMAALRDYTFEQAKPTFIQLRIYWGPATGIESDPRLARDYVPLYRYPAPQPGGDFVRKDAVARPEALQAARDYANATVPQIEDGLSTWPLRSCGSTLRPGQTTIGQH